MCVCVCECVCVCVCVHVQVHVAENYYVSDYVCVLCVLCLLLHNTCTCTSQGARTYKKDSGSRARGHALLIPDRPNCVTILSLGVVSSSV